NSGGFKIGCGWFAATMERIRISGSCTEGAFPSQAQLPGPFARAGAGRGGRGPFIRKRMTIGRPPEDILKLNAWMKSYAARVNATYVDYFSAMVDEKGWLKEGIANDGLHPTAEGYKIMAPIVSAAIERVG